MVHAVNSVTLSRHTSGVGQARERRTGGANSSERNTDHGACVAALRESLCRRDSALRLLAREPPLPAIRALIRAGTGTLADLKEKAENSCLNVAPVFILDAMSVVAAVAAATITPPS